MERVNGRQRRGQETRALVPQLPAQQVTQQHDRNAEQRRQRAHAGLARAERHDPEMQQDVIQRRVDVARHVLDDGGQVARGLHDASAFVRPQALRVKAVEAQRSRDEQDCKQDKR